VSGPVACVPWVSMPSAYQIAAAARVAARLAAARHGERGEVVRAACDELGCSRQSLYTWMRPHRGDAGRRQRSDAGRHGLLREEAEVIAAVIVEGGRGNGKRINTLVQTVDDLRADGLIHGCRVDSVCVLYYLPDGGVQVTDEAEHYKNKPHNLAAIAEYRVIRYVVTDHATGVVRWRYYPHSESGTHTIAFLAWCVVGGDPTRQPFRGVPRQLKVDPGATASGAVRRWCGLLGIDLIVCARGKPRAKGQVEQGQDLVETRFESGLRFQRHRVRNFNDLNRLAEVFQDHYNATATHSRHGRTRYDAWLTITPEQLRLVAESEAQLRRLATRRPKNRGCGGI